MAKDKERSLNPAAQQRKLDKAKALKKGKAEAQARRNEKLARRNPDRLQRQIDDLRALEEKGQIKPREKQMLEELDKDLKAVKKAREALGNKAPTFGKERQPRNDNNRDDRGVLGKRRWDGERRHHESDSGSDTDESVRRIPMPRDTPPPIPREYHQRKNLNRQFNEPEKENRDQRQPHALPQTTYESKTMYESAPQIRNLVQEATSRFIPNIVRKKISSTKGHGGLLEPEELDRLEKEGYAATAPGGGEDGGAGFQAQLQQGPPQAPASLVSRAQTDIEAYTAAEAEEEIRRLAEEEERFRAELMKQVTVEDVPDEDDL
ncbi:hypothetical protein UCRPC4_g03286 [Phaeomoniella chlamydospora]|uniref:Wbp11/ELF5/Saf1 N-terminal domain-containing protein n=1 Tax=Phaeomoniella chlamydospora TaxID=158046 RepID=A0A0G2EK78_PHACM|nr:hypothetical protein UCRPC4_g03286 [Phaeomoniella chlamydospora]